VSRGFLYVATGEKWIREAMASATQLRTIHPDIPIHIFTDVPAVIGPGVFEEIHRLPEQNWVNSEAKVWSLRRSPFDCTVFLDTDTYTCRDISDLFAVLDRFDFAAVPIPARLHKPHSHADPPDIPGAFQTPNGGMLVWRWSDATRTLFDLWWDLYSVDRASAGKGSRDQPSLRVAVWRSGVDILFLPSEYNARLPPRWSFPNTAVGEVRIIHARPRSLVDLERRWNARDTPRLLTPLPQFVAGVAADRLLPKQVTARFRTYRKRRATRAR
jgi:hypothetical protein